MEVKLQTLLTQALHGDEGQLYAPDALIPGRVEGGGNNDRYKLNMSRPERLEMKKNLAPSGIRPPIPRPAGQQLSHFTN